MILSHAVTSSAVYCGSLDLLGILHHGRRKEIAPLSERKSESEREATNRQGKDVNVSINPRISTKTKHRCFFWTPLFLFPSSLSLLPRLLARCRGATGRVRISYFVILDR